MKKLLILPLYILIMAASCQKPQKPQDLLPGKWGILAYTQGGVDKTSEYTNNHMAYKISFDVKGNFTETWNTATADFILTGTWTLEKGNTELMMVDNDPNSLNKIRQYIISNLTNTDCRLTLGDEVFDLRKF